MLYEVITIVIMQKRGNKVYTKTVDLTSDTSLQIANMMIYPNDTIYVTPNDTKIRNVGIQEIAPTLQLTNGIMAPVMTAKYLSE